MCALNKVKLCIWFLFGARKFIQYSICEQLFHVVVPVVHRIFISFTSASGASIVWDFYIFWAKSYIALALAQRDYAHIYSFAISHSFCHSSHAEIGLIANVTQCFFFAAAAHIYNCFKLKKQKCFVLIFFSILFICHVRRAARLQNEIKYIITKGNRARQRKETYIRIKTLSLRASRQSFREVRICTWSGDWRRYGWLVRWWWARSFVWTNRRISHRVE